MTMEHPQLDLTWCRKRQQRLCSQLAEQSIDLAVFTSHENIQYFTGFRPHRLMQAVVCLEADNTCTLIAPNAAPDHAATDHVYTFEAQWHATLRQEQPAVAADLLADSITRRPQRIGIACSESNAHLLRSFSMARHTPENVVDLDQMVWSLRRHKDPDEVAMIRRAIDCTEAMYERARRIIRPGITELEVFSELHAAAVDVAGEPLLALGNDFQCCSPGGPPRSRAAQDGELYILDLGPCCRGYYADNCRTIAVSGTPTDEQQQAWEAIVSVLDMVEQNARPGRSCQELFGEAKRTLDAHRPDAFTHHLGHGFGLFPHTAPHLNPHWDDRFEVGDTFTAEPGLYTDDLKAGIRLEQNYLVTENGVERLTQFSLEL